jgi:predicted dehydrogenase
MQNNSSDIFRRSFLKGAAGTAAFTLIRPELVRGAGKERLKAGIVGCGGRGTQAIVNLLTGTENVELVAMGDVFEDHLEQSLANIRDPQYIEKTVKRNGGPPPQLRVEDLVREIPKKIKVDPEHHFVGFDAYQKVINSDVDIVMLTTPPGYRPMHFEAAINAHKHVFTEKPVGTDPVGVRRFMAAAKKAEELKLTVVAGANRHADVSYKAMVKKIHDGGIGDVEALYARYIINSPVVHASKRDPKWGDMEWEHRNWYSFVWICGDQIVEQHFHNLDLMNWVMGTHPVKVVASGGRAWRTNEPVWGNIYDHMVSDFEYPNGVRLSSHCRQYNAKGLVHEISDLVVGSKGRLGGEGLVMDTTEKGIDPYCQEHMDLVNSIRGDGPYLNQGMSVANSTMTAIMGRESAYSGLMITWDMIMASKQDLQPKSFGYEVKMTVPPVPVPGVYKFV